MSFRPYEFADACYSRVYSELNPLLVKPQGDVHALY